MDKQDKKLSMLIVDDLEINRVILAQFFKQDFTVFEAENGKEAWKILEEQKVAIILLDMVMPVMDGMELLHELKRDERFSSIPVVVSTDRSGHDNAMRALELGALDYIMKPYNPIALNSRILNVMGRTENEWRKVEQKALENQIAAMRRLIERDALTGLYDRENFCRKASYLMRQDTDTRYAVIYFNISLFKVVNDLFGMETGNLVLRTAGAYLLRVVSEGGLAGHMAADHFAVCVPYDRVNMEALLAGLDDAVQSLSIRHRIQFYAGVYPVTNPSLPVPQMCDYAHMALNTVKGSYTTRYAFYDEGMWEVILEEQMLLREMDYALENGQFCIYVQPIRSLVEDRDTSAEALVRWIHPIHKMISPARFMPLFERNGFVTKLDRFVWEEACKLLAAERYQFGKALPLSVNVSRLDFYDEGLLDFFRGLISKYDIDPSLLKLEVTESAYTENPQQITETIQRFQKEGFRILMDDFGSGYSSLSMLRNVAVDILKIDMRFVQDIDSSRRGAVIMKNVVNMARDIAMDVVIEGVETKEQADFLREIGCDAVQGYYFAKPMPLLEYMQRLEKEAAS